MTIHDTPQKLAIAPSHSTQLSLQVAWQRWVTAHTNWASRLRHHQHRNFVFRLHWEPDTSAWWTKQWQGLHTATIAAHHAWTAWATQISRPAPATLSTHHQPGGRIAATTWSMALEEAQQAWPLVLRTTQSARTAMTPLDPEEARHLLIYANRYYTQIVHATERARRAAEG